MIPPDIETKLALQRRSPKIRCNWPASCPQSSSPLPKITPTRRKIILDKANILFLLLQISYRILLLATLLPFPTKRFHHSFVWMGLEINYTPLSERRQHQRSPRCKRCLLILIFVKGRENGDWRWVVSRSVPSQNRAVSS